MIADLPDKTEMQVYCVRRPIARRDMLADDDDGGDPFEDGAKRTPVHVVGRIIARSPVGAWWCAFVDQCGSPGRAERGRAFVRGGALLDLKVRPGCITAEIDGATRLRAIVSVSLPAVERQAAIRTQVEAAGEAAALQDVLPRIDLLPAPDELFGACGCTDHVPLCEHVMAALHGFGARLDAQPELLLLLRGVVIAAPSTTTSLVIGPLAPGKVALTGGLAALFRLNLRDEPLPALDDVVLGEQPPEPSPETTDDAVQIYDEALTSDPAEVVPALEETTIPTEPLAEVRRDYLKFIGIRSRTTDIWVREGVLLPTDRFHVYLRTPEVNRRIASKLAR